MEDAKKQLLLGELWTAKAMISGSSNSTSMLNQTTFPVHGPVVNIPSLATAAQAFKAQADCMERLAKVIEKILEAL